jgi:hypothetical protein
MLLRLNIKLPAKKELVEHHIEEEQRNVWKDVKEHLSDEERKAMNVKFLTAKSRVKV